MNHFFDFLLASYQGQSYLITGIEIIIFITGVWSVILSQRVHIAVYPVGIIATTLSIYLLYQAGYYGDMMINGYYTLMSIYGWILWSKTTNQKQITKTTQKEQWTSVIVFILTMLFVVLVYLWFGTPIGTENYLDIFTTGLFFVGMWLMANKKIENWVIWIVADAITVPLYLYKGLGVLALQYLLFTILAIQGYRRWKRLLK